MQSVNAWLVWRNRSSTYKEDIITLNAEIRVYKEQHNTLIKLSEENDKLREKNKELT